MSAGVPSRLVQDFSKKNNQLLHPDASNVPKISDQTVKKTTDSAQSLELSAELDTWIQDYINTGRPEAKGAVSMFNLLSFNDGMKSEYLKYGAAFASSIGSRHGGNAKIVGNVTHINGVAKPKEDAVTSSSVSANGEVQSGSGDWNEIALAHYPSILHFREMLLSEDYQSVNKRHRVPSLRDTCILMTSEIAVEELLRAASGGSKL